MTENESQGLRPAYRRMLMMLGTAPGLTFRTAAFLLAGLSFSLARPWVLGSAVDALEGANASSGELARVALAYAALFLGLSLVMNLLRFFYGDMRGQLVQNIQADLRLQALRKLHILSPVYYGAQDSGQIIARVSRDVQKMRPFFGMVVFSVIQLGLLVAGTFVLMGLHSLLLAGITLFFFGLTAGMMYRTAQRLQPLNRNADDIYDGVSLDIKENIEGVRIVKSFGREPRQQRRFTGKLDAYVRSTIAISDFWSVRMPLADAVFALSIPLILWIGGKYVIAGTMAKGAVVASIFYAQRIFHELRGLIRLVAVSQEAGVSAQRFFEMIDSPHTVPQAVSPSPLPAGRGRLTFENVSFSYPGAGRVLEDVSFEIAPGECVALVGPTGSGKSTLLSLLLRFFDPNTGCIRVDGADIRTIDLKDLRGAVGCVFQETFLFSAPLRANLAFAVCDITDEKILAAAATAQLSEFLKTLPEGLATVVGERGVTLSGGQKQRVSIARALLSDPRILLLDDAMASVDAVTERELVGSLRRAAEGRTTLVITQRLSGVRLADRAIVLDAGRIVDSGGHEELIRRCAVYRDLFAGQSLEQVTSHAG